MRNFAVLLLLLSLFAISPAPLEAQSRARRVETPTPADAPRTAPTPLPRQGPAPSQPPAGARPEAEAGEEVGEDDVVRVNAALVTIPVTVLDRDGRFISGLRQEDFRIFEDGVEQQVAFFGTVEQPFTVALVLDTSGSTRFKLDEIQQAAIAFLDQLRPEDRVLIVSFDDDVRLLAPPTSDRRLLYDAVRRTSNGGGTRLYDAVDYVIKQQFRRVRGRKAIVLFTDGVDTSSKRASYQSTLAEAEELDALVYPVQYDTFDAVQGGGGGGVSWPRRPSGGGILGDILGGIIIGGRRGGGGGGPGSSRGDYRRATEYLQSLAWMTGGRHHDASDLYNLERAFTNIAEELRRQYTLGYHPARQASVSSRRQIRVRVKRPNLVVRARDSYIYKPAGATAPPDTARDGAPAQAPEMRRRQFTDPRRTTMNE